MSQCRKKESVDLKRIKEKFNFYNFEELESFNGRGLVIEFSPSMDPYIYSDIKFYDNADLYETRERYIWECFERIVKSLGEDTCIVIKYNGKWIIDKNEVPELAKSLENMNVSNDFGGAIEVSKDSLLLKLFVESVLRYNSFLQFLFIEKKTILTPSDHMDIFVNALDVTMIENRITKNIDKNLFIINFLRKQKDK